MYLQGKERKKKKDILKTDTRGRALDTETKNQKS